MKRCPSCNRTYTDDALSFCLEDGSPLLSTNDAPQSPSSSFDPQATIAFQPARETNPPAPEVYRPTQPPPVNPVAPQSQWGQTPPPRPFTNAAAPPARKKSALPWILGVVGVLVVLGIGTVVLLVVLVNSSNSNNSNNSNKSTANANNANRNSNKSNSNNSNNSNSSSTASTFEDDFSSETWTSGTDEFGSSYYEDGEYLMHSTAGKYLVMLAPRESSYHTKDADVKVTVRSVSGEGSKFGHGIVIHGSVSGGEAAGYYFMIYTGETPQYKVTRSQASLLAPWTKSSAIRTGTNSNQLEVKVKGSQMAFYINGQYATSVSDSEFSDGLVGFYASETNVVAFDDLEISH